MSESSPLSIAPRFTRSVHIQRDFHDLRHRLQGYQVTPLVYQNASRVIAGLTTDSSERAFSVVGPFGSGKSAFGLFVAHFLQRHAASRRQLLDALKVPDAESWSIDAPSLLAVLVPGNHSSLRRAILVSLQQALANLKPPTSEITALCAEIDTNLHAPVLAPARVAELVSNAAALLREQGHFAGIFVLIDELGQFLDYAAHHDQEGDLFVLQSLAETATRSGNTPVLLMTILHQAFERYTVNAGTTRRIEWAKVQGRFVDLPFQEPSSQMIRMVAAALQPSSDDAYQDIRQQWSEQLALTADALGLRPADISLTEWQQIVGRSYPLHPTVLVALPMLFRQLAQNERSLFAFLSADEPWGLRDIIAASLADGQLPIYRLPQLFAYVETALGASLFGQVKGQRWAELAEAQALLGSADPLLADVLTTVGTIGALDRASGLRASQAHIAFALSDDLTDGAVADGLLLLQQRQFVAYRQHRDSYILWEGSDLDLDSLSQEARHSLSQRVTLPLLLQHYADLTPRIARRHSYRNGATRTFAIRYVDVQQLMTDPAPISGFDGELLHIVASDEEELQLAEVWASDAPRHDETGRITVLPQRVRELRSLLLDVAALRYLLDEREELEHDRPARREVASRLLEAQQLLAQVLSETYGGSHSHWFYRQLQRTVPNAQQIDALLSEAADATYYEAPRIWNELIVRRQLSSAAAKARRGLVQAMLEHGHEERLGIDGYPPERAIYESVLRAGTLHQQAADGTWRIGAPLDSDPLHLRPSWEAIERILEQESSDPYPLEALFQTLEAPPFGIKAGLTPLLFMAFYIAQAGEISLYERGNYVSIPDLATFERLLSRPEQFAVHLSRADGVRQLVYERLARALAPRALELPVQPALLAVAMPLLRIFKNLPGFSKQTRQLSRRAQAIRLALAQARSPDDLLFEQLPRACGITAFQANEEVDATRVDAFTARLRDGLQELQDAYPQLLRELATLIGTAFKLYSTGAAARAELQRRYQLIAETTNDSQLRSLGIRLETADSGDEAWVESVAALIARRSPESWSDDDLPAARVAIADLGRRFCNTEELVVAARAVPSETPLLRIGIANGHGELSRVLHLSEEDSAVQQLYSDLNATLERHIGLTSDQRATALAELLQALLSDQESRHALSNTD